MSAKSAHDRQSPIIHVGLMCEKIRTADPRVGSWQGCDSTPVAGFWSKVDRKSDSECWSWLGACFRDGYGVCHVGRQTFRAHRVAWQLANGRSPAGVVRHRCDNPICVNPSHLVVGTHAKNVEDRVSRGRSAVGERNGRHVLTTKDVLAIRSSGQTSRALAVLYGVYYDTILDIRRGRTWRHLLNRKAA